MTMGVELKHTWNIMMMLGKEYIKIPKAIPSEVKYIKKMMKDEENLNKQHPSSLVQENKLVREIYLLYKYSTWSYEERSRKKFPFIIRHHFVDILHFLNSSQMALLLSWIDDPILKSNTLQLYNSEPAQSQQKFHAQSYFHKTKQRQFVQTVTTFYIKPEADVLETPILFEFRYLNGILNHLISSKHGTHDHIKQAQLEKVLTKL